MFILVDSQLKISLEKKSRQIQAESSDFILNPACILKGAYKQHRHEYTFNHFLFFSFLFNWS